MNEHVDELLPFYINQTLTEDEHNRIQAHLSVCPACRQKLVGWERIAGTVSQLAHNPVVGPLPPLSPLVRARLLRRPSMWEAAFSALNLIWAQRVFLSSSWLLPSLGSFVVLAAVAALLLDRLASAWTRLPLFAVIPLVAALVTAFVYTFDDDPAGELVLAAPTSLAALIFARLTLALSAVSLLGFIGSLLATFAGLDPGSFFGLVAIWLGPMLVLSAMTTILSLCLHPRLASGAALALWGGLLILVFSEITGIKLIRVSLLWLVSPGWLLFAGETVFAGLLWLAAWGWLSHNPPAPTNLRG